MENPENQTNTRNFVSGRKLQCLNINWLGICSWNLENKQNQRNELLELQRRNELSWWVIKQNGTNLRVIFNPKDVDGIYNCKTHEK